MRSDRDEAAGSVAKAAVGAVRIDAGAVGKLLQTFLVTGQPPVTDQDVETEHQAWVEDPGRINKASGTNEELFEITGYTEQYFPLNFLSIQFSKYFLNLSVEKDALRQTEA